MNPPHDHRAESVAQVVTTAELLSRFASLMTRYLRAEVEQIAQLVARRAASLVTLTLLLGLVLGLALLSALTLAIGALLLLATLLPLWAAMLLAGAGFGLLACAVALYATSAFRRPSGSKGPLGALREPSFGAEAANP